jgi:hypothetical protein
MPNPATYEKLLKYSSKLKFGKDAHRRRKNGMQGIGIRCMFVYWVVAKQFDEEDY